MIRRWDIITIGNLSRNRYWGESEDRARRPALCTCTLVRADGLALLVDPSIVEASVMTAELDRRCGLKPSDVNAIFLTHAHGDHHAGLALFDAARWLAAPGVAEEINGSGKYAKAVEGVTAPIAGDIEVLATPGHTPHHHSLRFVCDGLRVLIAGDAVMTRDFWRDGRGYFNSADPQLAAQTIAWLGGLADVIVPGHDNYFLSRL